jgi:hypothetical protein
MSLYAERIEQFNKSVDDAKLHADNIASQVENLKAINRDPARSMFDKVNDSVSGVAGAIGNAAQIYHTYKHGKVLTFLEQHDINTALGRAGKGGLKNAGNETLNAIDQARNAPLSGVSPNSESLQLPKANELVSSLKGRIIGNESEGASPADLGQLVGRTKALADKADNLSSDAVNQVLSKAQPKADIQPPSRTAPAEVETNLDAVADAREVEAQAQPALESVTRNFLSRPLPAEGAGKALADAEQPIGSSVLGEAAEALQPIKINTNAISGGEKLIENLTSKAGDLGGDVDNAVNVAGTVAKSAGSTLGKMAGEGGGELLGDTIAGSMEAIAPETGPIAPLVAAVGGLVALGSSLAGLFHKNKPPPKIQPVAPPAAAQIGANLSVAK